MKTITLRLMLGLIVASLILSCKSYRNVEYLQPRVSKELQKGPFVRESLIKLIEEDRIFVQLKSGEEYYLNFVRVEVGTLKGTIFKIDGKIVKEGPFEPIEIPIGEIENLFVRRFSAATTIPSLVLGGIVVLMGVVLFSLAIDPIGWN